MHTFVGFIFGMAFPLFFPNQFARIRNKILSAITCNNCTNHDNKEHKQ